MRPRVALLEANLPGVPLFTPWLVKQWLNKGWVVIFAGNTSTCPERLLHLPGLRIESVSNALILSESLSGMVRIVVW